MEKVCHLSIAHLIPVLLSIVSKINGVNILHQISWDGGETWTNETYNLSDPDFVEIPASSIEEWEFHSNGAHDLFVLAVRYQSAEGPDIDLAFHVRDFSQGITPDTMTKIGLGDLDSTSGAGQDIRFDFASMAILNDGGAVIAYHDSSDEDPLFAVESILCHHMVLMFDQWFN